AINTFVITAIFIYVFSGLVGVNLPKYYPILNKWSVAALSGPSMGFYAKIPFALIPAAIIAVLFYLVAPLAQKHFQIRFKNFKSFTTISVLFGVMFFIAEEWHVWGIEKLKLDAGGFFNAELTFFIVVLLGFLFLGLGVLAMEKKIFD
ncbi:TPA: hypothetical protein H1009_02125, partial [archaeon]|nr:hypothetical protein [Candidatus Naiadarchaeales archaeon SRR2090153.bin461]